MPQLRLSKQCHLAKSDRYSPDILLWKLSTHDLHPESENPPVLDISLGYVRASSRLIGAACRVPGVATFRDANDPVDGRQPVVFVCVAPRDGGRHIDGRPYRPGIGAPPGRRSEPCRTPSTVHCPPSTAHLSPPTVHRSSQSGDHRPADGLTRAMTMTNTASWTTKALRRRQ